MVLDAADNRQDSNTKFVVIKSEGNFWSHTVSLSSKLHIFAMEKHLWVFLCIVFEQGHFAKH